MFKYLKEYRFYIILFIFVLIPIIAIDTSTRAPRDYRFYDRATIVVTYPIQRAITWFLETTVSGVNNYLFLLNTRQENLRLLSENRKLLGTIVNLRETQQENLRLRKLLEFKEVNYLDAVVARVIAKDVSSEFRSLRLNRGENSGIKKDMPVLNSEGIVGRVLRTTKETADVVTILDLLSAVDAIVKRSRARGIVQGMTDEVCQLKFALRTDDIKRGDVLITSGLGGIFPKGIPVGSVSKVNRLPYGITQAVEVRPSVNFSKVEEVLIIRGKLSTPIHISAPDPLPPSFDSPQPDEKPTPEGTETL